INLARSTRDVQRTVREAVQADKRIAIRSGGHAYEDFVDNPKTQVIIDLSEFKKVSYDRRHRAFAVHAGATLGEVYEALFKGWGVTVPGGSCPSVGAGGHVAGGGYGPLNRLHGLVSDHLWAVELVVVDHRRRARRVFACRDSEDEALRELWWAHTGGGGGNFGAVTRYWFRSPGAVGGNPEELLPQPPEDVWVSTVAWPWDRMSEESFSRLMKNYGGWTATHSAAGSPYAGLFSHLNITHQAAAAITMTTQMDATTPHAEQLLSDFIAAVSEGVGTAPQPRERRKLPWWHATNWPGLFGGDPTGRADFKSAYLRTNFTDAQVAACYRHLTRADFQNPVALVQIATYGARTNTIPADATAVAHRDSILKLHFLAAWGTDEHDAVNLAWLREFYRDVFADTGGVPVPNDVTDGCFINYADIDLSDPAWNSSGVPWHTLYYKDNYPRLQQVKARWDPNDVFQHAQSVELP
ncbi:MAG TPA: FAD-binding protein, partial [Pseudonocardiaceae bacterium]|nr:FAD-binding protein [Pseudonocardiaceae bacterium]